MKKTADRLYCRGTRKNANSEVNLKVRLGDHFAVDDQLDYISARVVGPDLTSLDPVASLQVQGANARLLTLAPLEDAAIDFSASAWGEDRVVDHQAVCQRALQLDIAIEKNRLTHANRTGANYETWHLDGCIYGIAKQRKRFGVTPFRKR